MKLYQEKNDSARAYRPIGRYKKIYFTTTGEYFRLGNRRIKFDDIPQLSYPVFLEDEDGKNIILGGYYPVCNSRALLIEVHPDREAVRVWEEVNKEA